MINFKNSFRPIILERGYNICDHAIENIRKIGDTYECDSLGSNGNKYYTYVRIKDNQFLDGSCTCPYGDNCKHMAALLIKLDRGSEVKDKSNDEVANYIDTLDIDKLRNILKTICNSDIKYYRMVNDLKDSGLSFKERIDKSINEYKSYLDDGKEEYRLSLDKLDKIRTDIKLTHINNPEEVKVLIYYMMDKIRELEEEPRYNEGYDLDNYKAEALFYFIELYNQAHDIRYIDYFLEELPYLEDYTLEDYESYLDDSLNEEVCKRILDKFEDFLYIPRDYLLAECFKRCDIKPDKQDEIRKRVDDVKAKVIDYLNTLDKTNQEELFKKNLDRAWSGSGLFEPIYSIAYNRYLRLNDKDKALDTLRTLYRCTERIEYYEKSLELSNKEAEIEYYKDTASRFELFDYLGDNEALMNEIKEAKNVYYYNEYYDKLSLLYKNDYISFYYKKLLDIANDSDDYEIEYVEDYIKRIINIDKESPYLYKLASYIYEEAYLKKSKLEKYSLLKKYYQK